MPVYNKACVGKTIRECETSDDGKSVTIRFTDGWEYSVDINPVTKRTLLVLCYPSIEYMEAHSLNQRNLAGEATVRDAYNERLRADISAEDAEYEAAQREYLDIEYDLDARA